MKNCDILSLQFISIFSRITLIINMKFFIKIGIGILCVLFWFVFSISINTGYVGFHSTFGKISDDIIKPGISFYNPFITSIIEVGNQLPESHVVMVISLYGSTCDKYWVTDLVKHQMNVICSNKTVHQLAISDFAELDDLLKNFIQSENNILSTGLKINFVRLSKPTLSISIQENYLNAAKEISAKIAKQAEYERKKIELATLEAIANSTNNILLANVTSTNEIKILIASATNEILINNATVNNKIMMLNAEAKFIEQLIIDNITVAKIKVNAIEKSYEAEHLKKLYDIPRYSDTVIANHTVTAVINSMIRINSMISPSFGFNGFTKIDQIHEINKFCETINTKH